MRVAVVFYQLAPTGGGAHTITTDVFMALRSMEAETHHSFVYYAAGDTPPAGVRAIETALPPHSSLRSISTWRERALRKRGSHPDQRTWLERSLDEEGVDFVWFASNHIEPCDRPYIQTIYDIEHIRQPWFPEVSRGGQWEHRQAYYGRFLPMASCVIAPNEVGRDQIVHHYSVNPDNVLCLHQPTPSFALRAGSVALLPRERVERLGVDGAYLFYPAQFWAHKNHPLLFDALVQLSDDGGRPYDLVLVGSDKGQLERMKRLARVTGVTERVHFLGFVTIEDLVALYQHAHALTYASFFGPENLPPLEAMALGCPVIAANVPGASSQLGDAALLVAPTKPAELAGEVRRLEDPELRGRLIRAGRTHVLDRTAAVYVRRILDVLDEFEGLGRCWLDQGSSDERSTDR